MGCYILVIGSGSLPVLSSCCRCILLLVVRDLKHDSQVNAAPLPPVSAALAASGALAMALPSATGTRAATAAALLHCLQTCCPANYSRHGMVQKIYTMRKRDMAHINQTRDILKIEYQSIEIVQ